MIVTDIYTCIYIYDIPLFSKIHLKTLAIYLYMYMIDNNIDFVLNFLMP